MEKKTTELSENQIEITIGEVFELEEALKNCGKIRGTLNLSLALSLNRIEVTKVADIIREESKPSEAFRKYKEARRALVAKLAVRESAGLKSEGPENKIVYKDPEAAVNQLQKLDDANVKVIIDQENVLAQYRDKISYETITLDVIRWIPQSLLHKTMEPDQIFGIHHLIEFSDKK